MPRTETSPTAVAWGANHRPKVQNNDAVSSPAGAGKESLRSVVAMSLTCAMCAA